MIITKNNIDTNPKSQCENSEPTPEVIELRCLRCKAVSNEILFWDIKGTKLCKCCEVCRIFYRMYNKKYRMLNKRPSRSNAALQARESARTADDIDADDIYISITCYTKEFEEDSDTSSSSSSDLF